MMPRLTQEELTKRASETPLPWSQDGGASYRKWYDARRRLHMRTRPKYMTPAQRRKHQREYIREYMRQRRKAERAKKGERNGHNRNTA